MQHVDGHAGNLGNECADHAAALGSLGLDASHDLAWFVKISTRLHVVVIVTASVKSCENCVPLELRQHRHLRTGVSDVFFIGFCVTLTHALRHCGFALSSLFRAAFPSCTAPGCSSGEAMESPTSCASTASSSGKSFAHNMWNIILDLLFHEQIGCVFCTFRRRNRLGQNCTLLSFALDVLCHKEKKSRFCITLHWAPLPVESTFFDSVASF